jgi:ribosomal protein S18 acetylase RimI-like enzyme
MAEAPAVTIREGVAADAHALAELGRIVVPAAYAHISPLETRRTLETWWTELSIAGSLRTYRHWVASSAGGELLGIANLGTRGGRAVMWKLYVHPEHQRLGLGRALLGEVLRATAGRPLWVSCVAGNTSAAAFCAATGFVVDHRESDPPYPDQVWMRREP